MYAKLVDFVRNEVDSKKIIAIDGRCGSGKSTFGLELAQALDANLIRMDDFFLQQYQRTEERYATPGENVDHERVKDVLLLWQQHKPFSYKKLDCKTFTLKEDVIFSEVKDRLVVEGTYSFHKDLIDFYDYKIFFTIDSETQLERIKKRNGIEGSQAFKDKWIPLEELYFSSKDPAKYADIIYDSEKGTLKEKKKWQKQ